MLRTKGHGDKRIQTDIQRQVSIISQDLDGFNMMYDSLSEA